MYNTIINVVISILRTVLHAGILAYTLRHSDMSVRNEPVLLFTFGAATAFVGEWYWIAHLLMAKGSIYPFSAIDVGEVGYELLYGAALNAALGLADVPDRGALTISGVFSAISAGLWVAWTGAWAKDILGGLSLWFLTYAIVRGIRRLGGSTLHCACQLAGIGVAIALLQVGAVCDLGGMGATLDALCNVGWLAGGVLLLAEMRILWRHDFVDDRFSCCSFLGFLWFHCATYLCYEPFYFAMVLCATIMAALSYQSLVRKAASA